MLPTDLAKDGHVSEVYSEHVKDPLLSFGRVAGNGGSGFSPGWFHQQSSGGDRVSQGIPELQLWQCLVGFSGVTNIRLCKVSDEPSAGDCMPCI